MTDEHYRDEWGRTHREDGPAIICTEEDSMEWWIKGKKHREDGPATICKNCKIWWIKGKKHREDGPALISTNSEEWYINGKLHRIGAPASINKELGIEVWSINGKQHRTDGPAVIIQDYEEWWLNGKKHREDGPAVISKTKKPFSCDNKKEWWLNGKLHREDGPAVVIEGYEDTEWYQYGEYIIQKWPYTHIAWYINNIHRNEKWVLEYLKLKEKHLLCGVMVSNKWRIREIILRWRYDPKLNCVKNRLE